MSTIQTIIAGLIIAVVAYFFGKSATTSEVIVESRIDTVRITITEPAPAAKVEQISSVTEAMPIVNIEQLRAQIVDSLISMGYTLEVAQRVEQLIPESAAVAIPINDYTFEGDDYEIGARGYDVTLNYINLYQTNTTSLVEQPRSWRLYGAVGVSNIGGAYYPTVGATITTRGRLAFGFSVGAYDGRAMWSGSVGYRILGE